MPTTPYQRPTMNAKKLELENLRKVTWFLVEAGLYSLLDFTKFCTANNIKIF